MRILIAGLGAIGQRHARNLRAILGADLELLAYRRRGLAHVVTETLQRDDSRNVEDGFDRVFTDLDEALGVRPGAVFVCTPSSQHVEIAQRALRVEQRSRHSMIFSFEKMALRDAIKQKAGAQAFAEGLYDLLHSSSSLQKRFERWVETVAGLPRRQTRVLTWPVVTVFGFIAQPDIHFFLKPKTIRAAARAYSFDFAYHSRPSWDTYASVLTLAGVKLILGG